MLACSLTLQKTIDRMLFLQSPAAMKLCPSPSSSLRPLPTRQHHLFRHRRVSAAAPVRKVLSIATERKSRFLFFFVSPRCSLAVSGSSPPSSTLDLLVLTPNPLAKPLWKTPKKRSAPLVARAEETRRSSLRLRSGAAAGATRRRRRQRGSSGLRVLPLPLPLRLRSPGPRPAS